MGSLRRFPDGLMLIDSGSYTSGPVSRSGHWAVLSGLYRAGEEPTSKKKRTLVVLSLKFAALTAWKEDLGQPAPQKPGSPKAQTPTPFCGARVYMSNLWWRGPYVAQTHRSCARLHCAWTDQQGGPDDKTI